jgi:hypothetical protein
MPHPEDPILPTHNDGPETGAKRYGRPRPHRLAQQDVRGSKQWMASKRHFCARSENSDFEREDICPPCHECGFREIESACDALHSTARKVARRLYDREGVPAPSFFYKDVDNSKRVAAIPGERNPHLRAETLMKESQIAGTRRPSVIGTGRPAIRLLGEDRRQAGCCWSAFD